MKWHNGKLHVHRFSVFGTCNAERIYACLGNSAVISQLPPAYSRIIDMIDRFDIADEGRMAAATAQECLLPDAVKHKSPKTSIQTSKDVCAHHTYVPRAPIR